MKRKISKVKIKKGRVVKISSKFSNIDQVAAGAIMKYDIVREARKLLAKIYRNGLERDKLIAIAVALRNARRL